MAEFALVLLVKRNLEEEHVKTIKTHDGLNSRLNVSSKKREMGAQAIETTMGKTHGIGVNETKHKAIPPTLFWKRKIRQFYLLSLTTKIDIIAFVVFCCSYAIFNLIYCISVL